MAEIRTVTTLSTKREEIQRVIAGYEAKLAQARADLAHITAAIKIFEATDDPDAMRAYVDTHRIWKRGELMTLCKGFLESEGPLSTKALAERMSVAPDSPKRPRRWSYCGRYERRETPNPKGLAPPFIFEGTSQ